MGNVKSKSLRRDASSSSKKKKTGFDRKHFQQLLESSERTESQDSEAQHQAPITARNREAPPGGEQPRKQAQGSQSNAPADVREDGRADEARQGGLKRQLKSRHIQMIALTSAIGTGLFLSLGSALQTGGPLGALLGYGLVGLVVAAVQYALGEVSALYPETGAFVRHAEILVDPALSFAVGWNVVYCSMVAVSSQITAILVLIEYWTDQHRGLLITLFIILTFAAGMIAVGIYGEVEFAMSCLKIALVIGIIIMGLVIDLGGVPGHSRIGFRYWKNPGPFVEYLTSGHWGKFLGFWAILNNAIYSLGGVEDVAIAATETKNPRYNIPKACRKIFAQVGFFYITTVLIIGMTLPSNDPALRNKSGTATESPFVIVATRAGIKFVPAIINAVVLTTAWSSANESIISGTRTILALAHEGKAPKVFEIVNGWGIPWVAVLLQTAVACFTYTVLWSGALKAFYYFLNLTAAGTLISWIVILFNHIRLRQAMKARGIPSEKLPWHHSWTPYTSRIALVSCILFLLTGGFPVFFPGHWDTGTFISAYLDIPVVLILYGSWKYFKKTNIVALDSIRIQEALDRAQVDRELNPDPPAPRGWHRISVLWA